MLTKFAYALLYGSAALFGIASWYAGVRLDAQGVAMYLALAGWLSALCILQRIAVRRARAEGVAAALRWAVKQSKKKDLPHA